MRERTVSLDCIVLMCTRGRGSAKASLKTKTSSSLMSLPGGNFLRTFFFPQAKLCNVLRSSGSSNDTLARR